MSNNAFQIKLIRFLRQENSDRDAKLESLKKTLSEMKQVHSQELEMEIFEFEERTGEKKYSNGLLRQHQKELRTRIKELEGKEVDITKFKQQLAYAFYLGYFLLFF